MRGPDQQQSHIFSYISPEQRVREDHPLRPMRTTWPAGYRISQKKRKRIEECLGWLKTIALLRKVRHRGTLKVDWMFTLACAA